MNGIVDVYEKYFTDLTSFQFDLHKRKQHSCLVCTTNITDSGSYGIYSQKSTEEFVINYLEHLKIFNYCIKLTEIFIQSVRENGILSSKVKRHWEIKKHIIMIFLNCVHPKIEIVDSIDNDTVRGEGGFGSTGNN